MYVSSCDGSEKIRASSSSSNKDPKLISVAPMIEFQRFIS